MDLSDFLHHDPRYASPYSSSSSVPLNYLNYPFRRFHISPPPPTTQSPSYQTLPPPPPLPPRHPQRAFSPTRLNAPIDSDQPPRHRLFSSPNHLDRPRRFYDRETRKPYRLDDHGNVNGGARFRSQYEDRDPHQSRLVGNHEAISFRDSKNCYDDRAYEELLRSGRRYEAYEIQRWGLERPPPPPPPPPQLQSEEELYDILKLSDRHDDNDVIVDDRVVVTEKNREYYNSESGRSSNGGSGSWWKQQIQKKSVLLRLQTPKKARERNYAGYFDSSGGSGGPSFRVGKDPYEYGYAYLRRKEEELLLGRKDEEEMSGGGGGEEGRGGGSSPLDLDVSFKSNSLVAKTTVRAREKRDSGSGSGSDMDCSESPTPAKKSEVVVSVGTLGFDLNKTASPEKDATKLKGVGTSSGINSQFCSVVTDDSLVNSEVETVAKDKILVEQGKEVGSSVKVPPKVSMKLKVVKKIVPKKIVKKVINPASKPKGKIDEVGPSSVCSFSVHAGKDETFSVFDTSTNDLCELPLDKKVEASLPNVVSDEESNVVNSCSTNIGDRSTKNMGSLRPVETVATQMAETPVKGLITVSNANSDVTDSIRVATCTEHAQIIETPVKGLITTSNANNDVADSLKAASCHEADSLKAASCHEADFGDVSKSICQSGDILVLDEAVQKESSQVMLSVKSNFSSDCLNSDEMYGTMSVKGFEHGAEITLEKPSQQESAVPDLCPVDAASKQSCFNQIPLSLQTGSAVEELPKAISFIENNVALGLSSSGETKAVHSKIGRRTRWDSDEVYIKKDDKSIAVSNKRNANSFGKQTSTECPSRSSEMCATVMSPSSPKSVGDTKKSTPIIQKKRTAKTKLDFSRISNTGVDTVNVSVRENVLDTAVSSLLKDPNHLEISVPGVQKLDMVGSQPGSDLVSVLNGKSSVDGFCNGKFSGRSDAKYDTDETSPEYKRRKVSGSHMVLPTEETIGGPANRSTFHTHDSLTHNEVPTHQVDKGTSSSIESHCATSNLIPSPEDINGYLEDIMAAVSSDNVARAGDSFTNNDMKFEYKGADTFSVPEASDIPRSLIHHPLQSRNENGTGVVIFNNHDPDIVNTDDSHEKDRDICATAEQIMVQDEVPCTIHSEPKPADIGDDSLCDEMKLDNICNMNKLSFMPSCLSSLARGNETTAANSVDEFMKSVPDSLSDTGTPETSTSIGDSHLLICKPAVKNNFDEKACEGDQKFDVKYEVASARNSLSVIKTNMTLGTVTESSQSVTGKTVPFQLQESKKTSHGLHLINKGALKSQLGQATNRILPGRPFSAFTTSQKATSSAHISKPRTWHRNANSSTDPLHTSTIPPQKQLPQRNGTFENNSYVRKGNSLVRRPSSVAAVPQSSQDLNSSVCQLNISGINGSKKCSGSDGRVDLKNPSSLMRTVEINAPSARPTPPQPSGVKIDTSAAMTLARPSSVAEPLRSELLGTKSDPMNCSETKVAEGSIKDMQETSVFQEEHSDTVKNVHDGNSESSNMKKVIYVKQKLNQLVASSNPSGVSVDNADKNQPSDAYYKRCKHQLIRSSLEGNGEKTVSNSTDDRNSGVQKALKGIPNRASNKKRSLKGKKNSLVWTSSGMQSSNNNSTPYDYQKVLPHPIPWKRARYLRTVMQTQASNNYGSSSIISKKLLFSRMRDTVYTRSTHGLSLRKYKVLSVGGSSLKWSKSIESRSKKVNEEATRAVAEVAKKKREQNVATCTTGLKIRTSPGKRIFCIGSVRYKMDPSRRTLQRIQDDNSSNSAVLNSDKAKTSYVPRRLVIGNGEYVRIGNGNQLVRDPKKRTRILASERVRWSLHTARQRLAKKRKYCQFFTRFGKCNKDDGKCPYIHDSSKIAVCTKYLKGLCSNSNCKLTHKVIPERMPDCSYFLQGLCTNKNCSYRHVNVNPKASTCEGFLKGYCVDGDECRKKHSYVCPTFEETGTCPEGPNCKLHHPKKRTKGKIKKRSRENKNGWGRYFLSKDVGVSDPVTALTKLPAETGNDMIGNDFIGINIGNKEAGERINIHEQTTFYDSDPSELDLDDLDELIKPIRLLKKLKTNN